MIGCTKLLCGTATVSEAVQSLKIGKVPARLLGFSDSLRPLVVWNMTNRCNLRCQHCYIEAEDRSYSDELSTDEAKAFLADLGEMGAPVVLFSGGEPLIRQDAFELTKFGTEAGLRVVYSTNGTLITEEVADKLAEAGAKYVGVSLDGDRTIHDQFRGREGAFDDALKGLSYAAKAGIPVGARFTANKVNMGDLPAVIDAVVENGIKRFCMYHLVYTGRGEDMLELDTSLEEKREIMDFVAKRTQELHAAGVELEILTVDNHADGVYLYRKVQEEQPERAEEVKQLLEMHGGCSAGVKISNVDPRGNVHPCQFWPHVTLGNVKEKPFSEIWLNKEDPFLNSMRDKPAHLKGRCGDCDYNSVCGGCRIRAEKVHGDIWEADPACYMTDEELGIVAT
ncbi:MAG TPA: radical SAM protein [Armatimonadota bacterium]|nr:radical SAM protein [Armatimonadota bacterium]